MQAPDRCFADADLSDGEIVKNKLGLPLPRSGQFAVVYELKHWDGRRFAVKCFTQQVTDHQMRYAAIAQHLANYRLPMLAEFSYLGQGIRVGPSWYPIVKMQWVDGQLLPDYIADRVTQPALLRQLAARWLVTIELLRADGIAHGDLQNGNIKVDGEQIRLVDYDGMYVPALHDRPPGETGHRHFQHPARMLTDYGPDVDNFSALVIYLSLVAVAADPSLWSAFHQEEGLILRQEDYERPGSTPIWGRLRANPDPEVPRLSAALEQSCAGPPSAVAALATLLTGDTVALDGPWWKVQTATPQPATPNGTHPPASQQPAVPWYRQPAGQPQPPAWIPPEDRAPAKAPRLSQIAQPAVPAPSEPKPPPMTVPSAGIWRVPAPANQPRTATKPAPAVATSVIVCPACGSRNTLPSDEFYCQRCGEALRGLQRCFCWRKREIPAGSHYCHECGRKG